MDTSENFNSGQALKSELEKKFYERYVRHFYSYDKEQNWLEMCEAMTHQNLDTYEHIIDRLRTERDETEDVIVTWDELDFALTEDGSKITVLGFPIHNQVMWFLGRYYLAITFTYYRRREYLQGNLGLMVELLKKIQPLKEHERLHVRITNNEVIFIVSHEETNFSSNYDLMYPVLQRYIKDIKSGRSKYYYPIISYIQDPIFTKVDTLFIPKSGDLNRYYAGYSLQTNYMFHGYSLPRVGMSTFLYSREWESIIDFYVHFQLLNSRRGATLGEDHKLSFHRSLKNTFYTDDLMFLSVPIEDLTKRIITFDNFEASYFDKVSISTKSRKLKDLARYSSIYADAMKRWSDRHYYSLLDYSFMWSYIIRSYYIGHDIIERWKFERALGKNLKRTVKGAIS